jgi:hypothetical protein
MTGMSLLSGLLRLKAIWKLIKTKHPEIEPDLKAFVVKGLKKKTPD